MVIDILVPPLSQTMDTLVLVEWVKQVGEPVTKGEVLFRVETDKATLDVEAPASGVLRTILAQPGDEIKIRACIGAIATVEELPGAAAAQAPAQFASGTGEEPPLVRPAPFPATGPLGEPLPPERQARIFASPRARQLVEQNRIPLAELRSLGTGPQNLIVARDVRAYLERRPPRPKATPLAQRMAAAAGVDLAAVAPTRPGAAITKADVAAQLQARSQPPLPDGRTGLSESSQVGEAGGPTPQPVQLSPTRKTIARRMLESHSATAPVTYLREVDATRLVRLRERLLKQLPEGAARPTYTDFLVRILGQVLPRHPDLNATFEGETLVHHAAVHLALAVDTGRGLVAPVIRSAQNLGVSALAQARVELVGRARAGELQPDELAGGTFTLSNLGPLGVDQFTPLLNPPQVAILGVGRIRPAPAAHKGRLRIRQLLGLCLTCDHRVVDGAPAARFLQAVGAWIENPDLIWTGAG